MDGWKKPDEQRGGIVGRGWIEGARRLSEEGRLAWLLGRGLQEALAGAARDAAKDAEAAAADLKAWVKRAVEATEGFSPKTSDVDRSKPLRRSSAPEPEEREPAPQWSELAGRRLDDRGYPVVFIGCRRIRGEWASLALGVDGNGKKHVLGGRDDAETPALVEELAGRGLAGEGGLLVVSDGSSAVDDAARATWRGRAQIQHCLYRLRHDLRDHTPSSMHAPIDEAIKGVERLPVDAALGSLRDLLDRLKGAHPGAAKRLERSLDAAVTVARLGVSDLLRQHLQIQGMVRVAFERSVALGRPHAAGLEAIASGIGAWLALTRRFYAASELPDLVERLDRGCQESVKEAAKE